MKPIRFEAGRRLSKSEKDEVLKSLGDSYKDYNAPKVLKGFDRISGDPRYGYEYNPDLMYRSDITGRLVRHYVILPDGRKAHPTEIFPNVTKSEIDKYAMEREYAESLKRSRDQSRANRIAASKAEANEKYKATGRKIPGSYFAQDEAGRIVRVDGTDADDVSYYTAQGFKQITPVVNMAKAITYKAEIRDDAFRVYVKGHPHNNSGWIKYNSHSERIASTQEARREAAEFIRQVKAGVLPLRNPTGSAKDSTQWEKLWTAYIRALGAYDAALSLGRDKWKPARMRVAKAEKAIEKFDPDAYRRFIVGKGHRSNPGGVHLPGLPKKAQREYEHILQESRATGRYGKRAKEVAARTVRKQYGRNPGPLARYEIYRKLQSRGEDVMAVVSATSSKDAIKYFHANHPVKSLEAQRKGWKLHARKLGVIRFNPYTDLVIKGQAKKVAGGWQVAGSKTGARGRGKVFESGRGTVQVASGVYLDKSSGLVYSKRERNMARRRVFKNPKGSLPTPQNQTEYRMFYDELHRLKHLGASRTAAESALMKKIMTALKRYDKALPRAKNIAGFKDADGVFHPIRSGMEMTSSGKLRKSRRKYKPKAVGEKRTYAPKRKAKKRATSRKRATTKKRATAKRRNPTFNMYVKNRFGPGQVHYGKVTAATAKAAKKVLFDQLKADYAYSKGEPRHKLKDITAKTANPKRRNASKKAGAPAGTSRWVVEQARVLRKRGYSYESAVQALNEWLKSNTRSTDAGFVRTYTEVAYGIKPKKKGNPRKGSRRWSGSTRKTGTHRKEMYAESVIDRYNFGLSDDYEKFKKARDYMKGRRRSPNPKIKITVKTKNKARRKGRRNPDAATIRKTFAGRVSKNSSLYFPDGTPGGLAKLGKLVKIQTRRGTIKLTRNPGEVWLCCDERGKFHLGSTVQAPLYAGPAGDLGEVQMIEYAESKPHLGYGKTIWFHKLGEEGGRKPTLHANSKGELRFKGGDYRITSRGIED